MAENPRSPTAAGSKSRTVRSQKIVPSADGASASERSEALDRVPPPTRSHTPGHLATKSQGGSSRRKASEQSIRARSQSVSSKSAYASPPPQSNPTPIPTLTLRRHGDYNTPVPTDPQAGSSSNLEADARRPTAMRSTSAIAGRATTMTSGSSGGSRKASAPPRPRGSHIPFPPLQDPKTAPDVPAAPSSGMYWSRAPVSGAPHTPLRAHTTTLVGSNVYVFGGCDSRACFNELYVLDADSFHWSSPHVTGDIPSPLRAMTCTAVGKKLVVFGGGDGPAYYNDVYVLDTVNFRWHQPRIIGDRTPSARRAHTACLYKNGIYMFGGGDGVRALNDIWRLDVTDPQKMSWKLISGPSTTSSSGTNGSTPATDLSKPKARGYHTANMVGSKLIIYGGSDGGECFNDVWVYDVDTHMWRAVHIPVTFRRLSHTSTIVGSYLFVVGGHDGNEYSNDVLLLNLVTMTWDKRKVYGLPPSGRGYHGTVLHDSRLVVIGGFDGGEVFSDVWILELAVHAYYSQISHFTIEV
ncbi:galactose oxidase [Hypoxylon trugodes]|uniref:galactose oxidase n=1 Tax=Hypoxylon trugodes TaxID=326681 RepID=UPI00218DA634|nr:galactose oxidase [Hypoxylon trugodes]KAI1392871.1 galactose oxidase [Hypoxylon trugodes]